MRTKLELDDKFNELYKEAREIGEKYSEPAKPGEDHTRHHHLYERHKEINISLRVLNWISGLDKEL